MADLSSSSQQVSLAAESRRHVTVLFTDLSDSTYLSGVMEAETYATMLDEVRSAFRAAVEARGGVANQYQGDGLQAIFGHAESTEHDGRHAVEAALEVHAVVRGLRRRYGSDGAGTLSVHSGLHAGQALLRPGDSVAGRIELFGPAPGIAKHLSDDAAADEILVSEETLGPATRLFDTGAPRAVLLKGRSEPLVVRSILSRRERRDRLEAQSQRGLIAFVGREVELARLEAVLDDVLPGRLRLAVVCAQPGLGKTRLAEELLHRAARRGFTVLRGGCDTELSAEPLQPFLHMLRAQLRITPDASATEMVQAIETGLAALDPALLTSQAELLQALSLAPRAGTAQRLPAERTICALHDVIVALGRRGPLALFIDDWQWADDATRQLLATIRRGGGELPLLLLVAQRPSLHDDLDLHTCERIDLPPFGEQEALATVADLLPAADPFVAGQIVRQGGGNPLFIEELCHFVARAGPTAALQPLRGGPAWLETLIASRVARLPPEQRRVIDAAAVIGTQVPSWLLERLTGCAPDHPCVTALAKQDLLFPAEEPGLLRFKHGITRDVVYGAIGLQARRNAHRQAATLLAAPGDADGEAQACEALAYHCSGADEYERAARCAALAGDKAMLASSIDRAKAQYRAALELLDRLPASDAQYQAWRSVVRKLGMASVFDPARADLQWFGRAAALAREHADGPGLAFACYWHGYVDYALGESRAAVEHAAAALVAAETAGDQRLVTQVHALEGQALAACGENAAAQALLDAALMRMLQTQRPGERPTLGLAFALACRASALGDRGRFDEAHLGFAHALEALPGPGHEVEGSVLCLRSNVYLWQGRWEEAATDAEAALRVAQRVRSLYLLAMSRALGAWADWLAARHTGDEARSLLAVRSLGGATAWLIARDKRLFISLNHGRLAEALATVGEAGPARQHAAMALRRWRGRDPLGTAMALRAMARLAMAQGQRGLARRRLALAERVAQSRDSAHEQAANARCREELGLAPVIA